MVSPYEFNDYKVYLKKRIAQADQRGFATRLAEASGCQRSYFSNVLNGNVHLIPDHLYGICEFLELSEEEREYLFLVLEHNRASNIEYRRHLSRKISQKQAGWKDFKNRLKKESLTPEKDESARQFYYSSWLFSAIHIAVSIPRLGELKSLCAYLGISEDLAKFHLEKLALMGLVEKKGTKWVWKSGDLHLSKDSPWIASHHSNWRMQALNDLPLRNADSLHYSVVQSLSKDHVEELRLRMIEWVEEFKKKAGPSSPEELVCFNLDFFKPEK
ncbi:DUF4423 domain-containing protein [Bdellovibrio sp. HCB290]|uniref:DUF4423 domain-containing protein n=1 Tax=Bdellovibrio sp. HCB290 TaxID=3394356 RepID=UPI0039B3AF67